MTPTGGGGQRDHRDDEALLAMLREDIPFGDLTTTSLAIGNIAALVKLSARGPMVVCGTEIAARLFELAGGVAEVTRGSGDVVEADALLVQARGSAGALHAAWKTAQTLAETLSGIATATRRIVDAVAIAGFAIPVACTRKNFPGTRRWTTEAVRAGGGVMHRLGLSETLLVFPEHLAFLSPGERAERVAALRRMQPEKRIVVEVGSADDALAMARAGVDVLQLERFTPEQLSSLRASLEGAGLRPLVAPAGGVTAGNAGEYAKAGADFLVTSAPYFSKPLDIRVVLGPETG